MVPYHPLRSLTLSNCAIRAKLMQKSHSQQDTSNFPGLGPREKRMRKPALLLQSTTTRFDGVCTLRTTDCRLVLPTLQDEDKSWQKQKKTDQKCLTMITMAAQSISLILLVTTLNISISQALPRGCKFLQVRCRSLGLNHFKRIKRPNF